MKQEALAEQLGISQQAISKIEQGENVEEVTLGRIANVLGVTSEAIKNFSEEAVFNSFNTFNDNSALHAAIGYNYQCTFNPLDKYIEAVEETRSCMKPF